MARPFLPALSVVLGFAACSSAVAADLEVIYTTRAGDTLIGLEKQFLANPFGWKGLKAHNRIGSPMHMPVGAPLRIPESWLRVEPRTARVVALRGDVTVDGQPLVVDAKVPAGAVLRTSGDAFVTLVMPDESRLTVQPGSEARLDKVQGFRGFSGQNTQIHLEKGRVETAVAPQRGPAARYQIRTPTALIGVRGTEFRVGSDALSQTAQAEVTGGEVRMRAGGGTAALPAGYGLVAKPGEAAATPRALLAAPTIKDVPTVFERVEMRFAFPPVAGAVAYRAQIARDAQFIDVLKTVVSPTPSARFSGLPDGAYWLRVRAIDGAGLEGFDAGQAVELRARPEAPVALTPGSGELAWSPAAEAVGYRLQVARDAAFSTLVAERDTTALSAEAALPAGNYQWRIASRRASGERGPWSDPHLLSIRQAPGAASLTVYNGRARFAWPAGPGGRIYEFQLARDEAFKDLLLEQRIGEPAVTVPLPSAGSYYVRMRANDSDGVASPWSAVQTFRSTYLLPLWSLSAPDATSP